MSKRKHARNFNSAFLGRIRYICTGFLSYFIAEIFFLILDSAVSYVNFYTKDDEESDEDIDDLFFDVDLDSNVSENLKKLDFKRSKNGYGESIMDSVSFNMIKNFCY